MVKAWDFLERWVHEHVKATHDDDEAAKREKASKLAERCLFLLTGLDGATPAVKKSASEKTI